MAAIVCIGCAVADVMVCGLEVKDSQIQTEFHDRFHLVEHIQAEAGGDALNEAVVLGKLGKDVGIVCGLGDDLIGHSIESRLRGSGVDTSHIYWHSEAKTQINMLLVQQDKEKYFIEEPVSECMCFAPDESAFHQAQIVSMASLFSAPFDNKDVIHKTIYYAKKLGATVCADVILNPFTVLSLRDLQDSLALIDYFFPNEEEARVLTGRETIEEMADSLRDYGIKNIIIKLGDRGCYIRNDHMAEYFGTFQGNMVDSTGAGDCFMAGFIAALSEGKSIRQCCLFASAAAVLAVESIGAASGITSREQVETIMRERPWKEAGDAAVCHQT